MNENLAVGITMLFRDLDGKSPKQIKEDDKLIASARKFCEAWRLIVAGGGNPAKLIVGIEEQDLLYVLNMSSRAIR